MRKPRSPLRGVAVNTAEDICSNYRQTLTWHRVRESNPLSVTKLVVQNSMAVAAKHVALLYFCQYAFLRPSIVDRVGDFQILLSIASMVEIQNRRVVFSALYAAQICFESVIPSPHLCSSRVDCEFGSVRILGVPFSPVFTELFLVQFFVHVGHILETDALPLS